MATVFIPAQLRELTGGLDRLDIEATTLGRVLEALEERFPGIKARLCEGDRIAPTLQVSIDGAINARGLMAKVSPESEVHFLPAIGGG